MRTVSGAKDAVLAAARVGAKVHGCQLQAGDRRVHPGEKGAAVTLHIAILLQLNCL